MDIHCIVIINDQIVCSGTYKECIKFADKKESKREDERPSTKPYVFQEIKR